MFRAPYAFSKRPRTRQVRQAFWLLKEPLFWQFPFFENILKLKGSNFVEQTLSKGEIQWLLVSRSISEMQFAWRKSSYHKLLTWSWYTAISIRAVQFAPKLIDYRGKTIHLCEWFHRNDLPEMILLKLCSFTSTCHRAALVLGTDGSQIAGHHQSGILSRRSVQ